VVKAAGALWRVAYAALFVLALPVGLVLWARAAARVVTLPVVHDPGPGLVLVAAGLLLLAAGAWDLVARGGGLPMNAFPPPRFVRTGIYRWIRNPMYIGFTLACAGVSIAVGHAVGLWLVTPTVGLGAAALVYGFERHDLARRFGPEALAPALLSLPRGDGEPPAPAQRLAVFLWICFPWLVAYYAVQALGRPADAFGTALPLERRWPVWQWTEIFYASTYLLIPLTALVVRTRRDLRRFAVQSAVAAVIVTLLWLVIPVVAVNRPFTPAGFPGRLLAYEQGHSRGVAAFPAFHVLWTLLAADAWSANARVTGRRGWAWVGWIWATLITASCLTTGMHTVIEVAAAFVLYVPLHRIETAWAWVRGLAEQLANSWKEWRVGPVRVIVHGVYAAAAAGVGLLVAGSAAGPGRLAVVIWIGVCILLGAGLWAQALEGSSKLLRPFGWYGGVVGGVIGAVTARLAGAPILPALAAFALAAPWIQILGRLRCLVQGCCHGGPAPAGVGIVYRQRRSRVTQLAHLAGVPIHATPLYSIAGNVVIGLLLARLRCLGAPDALLVGVYLILGGTARFVEESYRAEPQTPIVAGLRIYQWVAIASVVMGAICTTLSSPAVHLPFSPPTGGLVVAALALALVTGCAMGVDFPGSNRRFSRLAAAD
jgi:protein-S-isoprenylcysteine O-methyltransferase Ste14